MKNTKTSLATRTRDPRHANATPSRWDWHERTLRQLREALLRKHNERSLAATRPVEAGGNDLVDVATEECTHSILLAELAAEDNALVEIDAALGRIRDGVYGICEDTGDAIAAARLRAIPWTRYSRAAAARRESAGTRRR